MRIHHGFAVILLFIHAASAAASTTRALLQDGSCSVTKPCPNAAHCCSQWGYCGTTSEYCGAGCKSGPCHGSSPPPPAPRPPPPAPPAAAAGWKSFFTKTKFEQWFPDRRQDFYTFEEFTRAADAYPKFGNEGSSTAVNKREIAAFFGNVQQESGGLYYVEEINGPTDPNKKYCDANNREYPCAAGKKYFGRGPIQLSWNYNYGACGKALGLSLLSDPDQVARSAATAFKTALWFWMTQGCHDQMVKRTPPSFAGTIRIINGDQECGHGSDARVENRVKYYTTFCNSLGVDTGTDLRC